MRNEKDKLIEEIIEMERELGRKIDTYRIDFIVARYHMMLFTDVSTRAEMRNELKKRSINELKKIKKFFRKQSKCFTRENKLLRNQLATLKQILKKEYNKNKKVELIEELSEVETYLNTIEVYGKITKKNAERAKKLIDKYKTEIFLEAV